MKHTYLIARPLILLAAAFLAWHFGHAGAGALCFIVFLLVMLWGS